MPKPSEHPQIVRVLLFGAPGVGKNCLESRVHSLPRCSLKADTSANPESQFTTATYPPPYDPQLTLSVRRHLTLPTLECPLSGLPVSHVLPKTTSPSPSSSSSSCAPEKPAQPRHPESPRPPPSEYMVEIVNHPGLQRPSERLRVLAHDAFDAVVIVYDVTSQASFAAADAIHREVRQVFPLENGKRLTWRMGSLRSPSPKPVVALVGNKSDLALPAPAHSVFERPSTQQQQQQQQPPRSSAPLPDQSPRRAGHAVIESWRRLETGCAAHPRHSSPAVATNDAANDAANDTRGTRQVSTEQGLELAAAIGLGTAFFEASAKTGANVDCVFETVVRAVRREEVAAADVASLSRRMSIRKSASKRESGRDARSLAVRRTGDGRREGQGQGRREGQEKREKQRPQDEQEEKAGGGGMLKKARSLFTRQTPALPPLAHHSARECK